MVIVSGRLFLRPGCREEFVKSSMVALHLARKAIGCLDFVVAADPLEENRVNVYEEWETEADLNRFRAEGPDDSLSSMIVRAEVSQRVVE